MVQKHSFPDGSYVLHGVAFAHYAGRFSVWADKNGNMTDCQYGATPRYPNGRAVPQRACVLRASLAARAKLWKVG